MSLYVMYLNFPHTPHI